MEFYKILILTITTALIVFFIPFSEIINKRKLLKLFSTKIRREFLYGFSWSTNGLLLEEIHHNSIQIKLFGIFWVELKRYDINIK